MYFIAIMIIIITKTVIISGVSLASIDPWLSSHIWPWTLSRTEATVKQLLCWGVSTVFIEIAHYLLFNASGKIRRPPAVPIWSSWEGGELTWQKDTLTHFSPECLSINSTWGLRYLLIASNTSMSCQEGMRSLVFLSLERIWEIGFCCLRIRSIMSCRDTHLVGQPVLRECPGSFFLCLLCFSTAAGEGTE